MYAIRVIYDQLKYSDICVYLAEVVRGKSSFCWSGTLIQCLARVTIASASMAPNPK